MSSEIGAASVVRTLEKLGCESVFGIPGIHNLDIYEALMKSSVRHVTARNEAGAGFMAMGAAQRSGKPGCALVISGPGLTNILTAMGEAYHDSVPLVVISSQIPSGLLERRTGYLHELRESTRMSSSVTKASYRVEHGEEIERILSMAFHRSATGRPGPVHVELPLDILQSSLSGEEEVHQSQNAAAMLEGLRRVAVIAGGGAANASAELRSFAETFSAPVVTTAAGKGVIDERHPLALGGRLHLPAVKKYVRDMDAVIAVGTQLSPTDTWEEVPLKLPEAAVVINVDPGEFSRNLCCGAGIRSDAAGGLAALQDRLEPISRPEAKEEAERLRSACDRQVAEVIGAGKDFSRIRTMLSALRRALPERGALFTDMTGPAYAALSEWTAYRPRSFFHPVGFGTLGYALPAAVGAAAAEPKEAYCVLVGDGGLQFTLQELAVARDLELPLPIVVWNDGGYGEIRKSEEARHPGRRIAVDHRPPEFESLAAAYGMGFYRIEDPDQLEREATRTLAGKGPAILEIPAGRMKGEI